MPREKVRRTEIDGLSGGWLVLWWTEGLSLLSLSGRNVHSGNMYLHTFPYRRKRARERS